MLLAVCPHCQFISPGVEDCLFTAALSFRHLVSLTEMSGHHVSDSRTKIFQVQDISVCLKCFRFVFVVEENQGGIGISVGMRGRMGLAVK